MHESLYVEEFWRVVAISVRTAPASILVVQTEGSGRAWAKIASCHWISFKILLSCEQLNRQRTDCSVKELELHFWLPPPAQFGGFFKIRYQNAKIENKLKCKKYHLHEVSTVLILNISKNSSKIECIFFFFFVKGGEMDNLNYKKAWITPHTSIYLWTKRFTLRKWDLGLFDKLLQTTWIFH